jgi:Putative zinc-finger
MTCRHCRRLLSPHLDNALATDERSGVLAHLAQCSACAERLHQLESNRQLLHTLPTAEVTRGMELLLQSRIQHLQSPVSSPKAQGSSRKSQAWWRGWGMISAGTLVTCAASIFFFFSNIHTPPPVSAEEVVSSMEELIVVLNSDDDLKEMYEETAEEAAPNWYEDLDQWPAGDGNFPRR